MLSRLAFFTFTCALLASPFAGASTCRVQRVEQTCASADCSQSALDDFAAYAAEEKACGVFEANLPYISLTTETPRGTVILLHGVTANPAHMRDLTHTLNITGYHVVVPILFGQGGVDQFLTQSSADQWHSDVEFAIVQARKLGQPLYLFGHSLGGALAAVAASEHPGEFKAFASFDPALNLKGRSSGVIKYACLASHVWDYPEDIGRGVLGFWLASDDDQHPITHAVPSRELDVEIVKEKNEFYARNFCGEGTVIPSYNYQLTLQAVCGLSDTVNKITEESIAGLPPSLVLLSQDQTVFDQISKPELKRAMSASPQNLVFESSAPMHTAMMGKCTPGYTVNVRKLVRWFQQHP